ncbi:hypothetical protein DFQ28_005953 [Apophysomyces sp. BC1034]|nr:hypothetical protein DFQ30_008303 [Apophysomyces sp. BC1015]KAG0181802.1 hypothetical protein DFQ29_007030 [Apophysomyces sp. BC1021]KAG0187696.1 hypothetical protein DFQ28_005953 [Apophysomyces sp. BC1034]
MSKLLKSRRRGRGIEEEDKSSSEGEDLSSDQYSSSEGEGEDEDDYDDDDDDDSDEGDEDESENELSTTGEVTAGSSKHRTVTSKVAAKAAEVVEVIDYQTRQKEVAYTSPALVSESNSKESEKHEPEGHTFEEHTFEEHVSDHNAPQEQDVENREPVEDTEVRPHERRVLEQRAYRRKLAEDPSFVPYVGQFWGHDDRYREDALRPTEDSHHVQLRTPSFAPPADNRSADKRRLGGFTNRAETDYDMLTKQKWTHDGYEELMRLEQVEEQHKRERLERRDLQRVKDERPDRNRSRRSNQERVTGTPDAGASRWQQFSNNIQPTQEWPDLQQAAKPVNKKAAKKLDVNKKERISGTKDRKGSSAEINSHGEKFAKKPAVLNDAIKSDDAKPEAESMKPEEVATVDDKLQQNDRDTSKNETTLNGWGSHTDAEKPAQDSWTSSDTPAKNSDWNSNEDLKADSWGATAVPSENDNSSWQKSFEAPTLPTWGASETTDKGSNGTRKPWASNDEQNQATKVAANSRQKTKKGYLAKKTLQNSDKDLKSDSLRKPTDTMPSSPKPSTTAAPVESAVESRAISKKDTLKQGSEGWSVDASVTTGATDIANIANDANTWTPDKIDQNQSANKPEQSGWGPAVCETTDAGWSSTASWHDIEANKQDNQKSKEPFKGVKEEGGKKNEGTEYASTAWTSWNNASTKAPRRGRGYLSKKKPETDLPEAPTKVEVERNTANDGDSKQNTAAAVNGGKKTALADKTKVIEEHAAEREGRDEESDVEIILEAEAESSWGSSEQILGIPTPPPGAEKDTGKDDGWDGYEGGRGYRSKGKHHDKLNDRPTASWDSTAPAHGSSDWRNKGNDKPASVESSAASINSERHPHQGLPAGGAYVYPQPMLTSPNAPPNIAYIPMASNGGATIPMYPMPFQPMPMPPGAVMANGGASDDGSPYYQPASVPFNATAGQSAAGYEANGMVYYGMNPSAVYPYYYYSAMPMQGSPGMVMQQNPMNSYSNYMEETDEPVDGWGSEPEEPVNDSGWKIEGSPSARHSTSKKTSAKAVNYNAPHYFTSSAYPS